MNKLARFSIIGSAVALAASLAAGPAEADVLDDLREADKAFQEGDYGDAAKYYDRAIRDGSCQEVAAQAYGKRAAIFFIQNEYQAGLQFITQKAERCHPDAPEILEQKALMLWSLGSKPDAIEVAEAVVESKPASYSNQLLITEFYYPREPQRVIDAAQAYLANRPGELSSQDVLPRLRLALSYLEVADDLQESDKEGNEGRIESLWTKAKEQFELVLKRHRQRPYAEVNAQNGLCAVYTALGEFNRAITTCERIIQDPRKIDRRGAVWFNLGQAYLGLNQARRARTAGMEFIRMRKSEPKGYILVGDAYFAQRNWDRALEYYKDAGELAKGRADIAAELGVKLGKTYLRRGDVDLAIVELENALERDPDSVVLATELGSAYIQARRDGKALATVDKRINGDGYQELGESDRTDLQIIAAKASYNQGEYEQALSHFESAHELDPKDVKVRIGLVRTVNYQAHQAFQAGKMDAASEHLSRALEVDRDNNLTNQNVAVLALAQDDCKRAGKHLTRLEGSRSYALVYHRLMGRAYLCAGNEKKAARHYARAEKEAIDVQANLMRAEIYTEWAPLMWDDDLDDAVDKLDTARQFTVQNKDVRPAVQRNLALALFRRGMRQMKAGDGAQAASAFERATRNPQLLKGGEPLAFDMSLALALLDQGDTARAGKLLDKLAQKGNPGAYLKSPYDKLGPTLFGAYAKYRSGNTKLRQQAAREFAKLSRRAPGKLGTQIKDLAASSYHYLAWDDYRRGRTRNAAADLRNADRLAASGYIKRDVGHNQAVLKIGGGKPARGLLRTFQQLGDTPPQALANLGILYDRLGKPKDAYQAWVRARAKGVRDRDLNRWIDAKKRIFGY